MSSVADLGIFRHSVGFLLIELVPQWLVVVKTGRLCFHLTHASLYSSSEPSPIDMPAKQFYFITAGHMADI